MNFFFVRPGDGTLTYFVSDVSTTQPAALAGLQAKSIIIPSRHGVRESTTQALALVGLRAKSIVIPDRDGVRDTYQLEFDSGVVEAREGDIVALPYPVDGYQAFVLKNLSSDWEHLIVGLTFEGDEAGYVAIVEAAPRNLAEIPLQYPAGQGLPDPVKITGITATATSELASNGRLAANAVNGVYYDGNFWESVGTVEGFGEDRDPAITFDLQTVHQVDHFLIWNSHEHTPAIKRMFVEVSVDGTSFTRLPGEFPLESNAAASAQKVLLGGVAARFVRFAIMENYAGVTFPVVGNPIGWSLVAIDEVEFFGGPGGVAVAPTVTQSPASVTVTTGQPAQFTVTATGTAPLSYQWRKGGVALSNGGNVSGATTATLTLANVQAGDVGSYNVAVSNPAGSKVSDAATLAVNASSLVADNFDDNVRNPLIWAGSDQTEGRAALTETDQRLEYRVSIPDNAGGDQAYRPLASSIAVPADQDWEATVDLHNAAVASNGKWASIGLALLTPDESRNVFLELYAADSARGFVTGLAADGEPVGADGDTGNLGNTGGSARLVFNRTSKVVSAFYDADGSANGFQWVQLASYGLAGAGGSSGNDNWQLGPGDTLVLAVGGYSEGVTVNAGQAYLDNFAFARESSGQAPTITASPQPLTVVSGQPAQFTVTATGTAPLSYQWRKGGVALSNGGNTSGATTATLTLANVQAGDAGSYDVVVSNAAGAKTSDPATLTVSQPAVAPSITQQPVSVTMTAGQEATFTVTAMGSAPLGYQWRKGGVALNNGGNITGANTASLTLANVQAGDAGSYEVVVSNTAGSKTSDAAALAVGVNQVARELLLYLPFTGNAQDTSGNNRHGQVTDATLTADRTGNPDSAYAFAGTSLISVGDLDPDNYAQGFSFGCWLKPDFGGGSPAYWVHDAGWGSTFIILGAPSSLHFRFGSGSAATDYGVGGLNLTLGQWHHIFVTHDVAFDRLYVNGAQVSEKPSLPLQGNVSTLEVGKDGFQGSIDEFAVFGRGLAPGEVQAIYEGGLNPTVAIAPTIAQQPFNLMATVGQSAQFTVTATGTAPLGYQWRKGGASLNNGGNVSGADTATLTLANVQLADTGGYDVVVGNAAGAKASEVVTLTVVPALPTISQQPQSQSVETGSPVTFIVGFQSAEGLTYQWLKNGEELPGKTTSQLELTAVQLADTGDYRLRIFNGLATLLTDPATLTVRPPAVAPGFTQQPSNLTVLAGQPAQFTVTATGTAPFSYQWRKGGNPLSNAGNISGADTAALVLASVQAVDAGSYDVVVSNTAGAKTSEPATLTVSQPAVAPSITQQPVNVAVTAGQAAQFTVVATGTAPLAYEWRKGGVALNNGGKVSGANTATLVLANVQAGDAGSYDVVVSNTAGNKTSDAVTLTVQPSVVPKKITGVVATATSELASHNRLASHAVDGVYCDSSFWESIGVGFGFVPDREDRDPAITFDFGQSVQLDRFMIWNGHENEAAIKRMVVEVSPDGVTFTSRGEVELSLPGGCPPIPQSVPLDGVTARFVRFDILENYAGVIFPVVGNPSGWSLVAIDEVEFFATSGGVPEVPVANFLEWYRADSAQFSGLADGDPIVNWLPETGSAATPVPVQVAGQEIRYRKSVAGLNGLPALEFPGGPSVINNIGKVDFNGVSMFLVFRNIGSGGLHRAVAGLDSNTLLGPWNPSQAGRYNPTIHFGGVWKIHPEDVVGWSDPGTCVLSVVMDDLATEHSFINGVELDSTKGGAGPMDTTGIGRLSFGGGAGGEPYKGHVAEFILYKRTLSAAETDVVHNYLLTKYGLKGTTSTAPEITGQPAGLSVPPGGTAHFTVTANGTAPLRYKWRKGGTQLNNGATTSGADTATLTLANVQAGDAGSYDVIVSNGTGSKTSDPATLTVQPPAVAPTIVTQPASLTVAAGQDAFLAVTATGTAPLAYQWLFTPAAGGTEQALANANAATLALAAVAPAQAGAYRVRISNEASPAGMFSQPATLTITMATGGFVNRRLPGVYVPGKPFEVVLEAKPAATVAFYAVADRPPTGWVVSAISDGGVIDARTGQVKFGPYADNAPRTLRYTVLPPGAVSGRFEFTGVASADGVETVIGGTGSLENAVNHPADLGADQRLAITEVTAYGAAWKRGETWTLPPNPVPVNYVTRAGFLWRNGEVYRLDPSAGVAPLWWVPDAANTPTVVRQTVTEASTATRTFAGNSVTVAVAPAENVSVYAVEERLFAGFTAKDISHGGVFLAEQGLVRWGPFFDHQARELMYTVGAPSNFEGQIAVLGLVSEDGDSLPVAGDSVLRFGTTELPPPVTPEFSGDSFMLDVAGPLNARVVIETSDLLGGIWTVATEFELNKPDQRWSVPVEIQESGKFFRVRVIVP